MIIETFSAPSSGPTATLVTIQFRMDKGLQAHISGMQSQAAKDLLVKLRQAFLEQKLHWPRGNRTWHVQPSANWGHPAGLDLSIALCMLAGSGGIPPSRIRKVGSLGLLGLRGDVQAHPDWQRWVVEDESVEEWLIPHGWKPETLQLPPHLRLHPVRTLREALDHLTGRKKIAPLTLTHRNPTPAETPQDALAGLEDLEGEWTARLGLSLAVIGHHPMILMGAPGTGKSMCARILHGLLPLMRPSEGHAVRKRFAARGLVHDALLVPPFRSPHSGASAAGMFGHCPVRSNGLTHPIPGEVTLAHHGVLCLDEFTEFSRPVIEGLRTVIDQGQIAIARAHGAVRLPAHPLLVITSNPCACGYRLDADRHRCHCTPGESRRYFQRIKGPVLDRLAIHIETGTPDGGSPAPDNCPSDLRTSAAARLRIQKAMELRRQTHRQRRPHVEPEAMRMLERAALVHHWSLRAKGAVQQVAASHMWWRIAGESGPACIRSVDMEMAIGFRIFDRASWMNAHFRKSAGGRSAADVQRAHKS